MKKLLTLFTALLLFGSMTVVQAADVYRVAGSSSLFGSNWSTTDDNNKMTLQDGKYRLVKENTSSSAKSVEFKVVKNGSWDYAYPSSNYSISVPGNTKLLITYTTSGNAVNAQILGGYVGAHGTMTNSNWATVQFTAASDKETASHTYSLAANSNYSFGMRVGANNNWTSNGSAFTRANNSKTITSGSGNCSLATDVAGDYTFTWTYETNTLTVTYPPQAGEYAITATTATHWTYGSLPSSKTSGETVQFTVTPDAGYSVTVSSSDVTITKNGNNYSFTMPNKAVAITVAATPISYNISYPASPSHYTLAGGNPTSGNTDAAINFTATPDENYFLTVTVNGSVVAGNNNVYSFTMPAEAVTVAITATPYRIFDGSTKIYLKADAVSWWLDANAVQKATFTKADNTTVTVTGALEEGVIYAFTPAAGAYKSVQFSRHNPSNVSEDWGHTDAINLIGTEANDYVTVFAQNSGTATWSTFVPSPSYTFTSGTTIYYDLREYNGGVDDKDGVWHANTDDIFSVTLASDWKVTANTHLFKSEPNDWSYKTCDDIPTEGQNMIVSTDGINCHWDTYVPPVDPIVEFVSLGNTIGLGMTVKFAATSNHIGEANAPAHHYKFYVKKGDADYGSAVTSYTFAETGTYTVKATAFNSDESVAEHATKEITVIDGAHIIYYVNHNAWAQVYVHMWGASPGTVWPGDEMTLTTSVTEKNQYSVYAVTFTPNYTNLKFNYNANQTGDLSRDMDKPYYFNGQWYATLEECDPLTASLSGLEDSYLVGASATISATSNLTDASYSYQVKIDDGEYAALSVEDPYTFTAAGTYTFKVTAIGDEGSKMATQTVTVYAPLTIYFVNKEGWSNLHAYFYTPEKTGWPGDPMSLTEATTARHHYEVYSSTIGAGAHANVVFNNGSSQTGDLTINAAKPYYYDGEWYATLAEIDPETYVDFDGVAATVLVNTPLTLAATSNVTNPTYNYYVKPAGGDYAAISSPHTFDATGIYTLKVEALENGEGDPVASREKEIEVYTTHTFTAGTRIYVDFSAMTEGSKKVNYPKNNEADLAYDEEGAGTFKTIRFSEDVEWSTLNAFIKTEKNSWNGLKFTVPAEGQNKIIVAADGASYTWGTYTPETVQVKFFAPRNETHKWEHVYAYSWDDAGAITGWTSDEVTRDGEWYVYDVQVGANLLFHDNNSMQTNDINNITTAKCYVSTAINDGVDPQKVTVTEQCTVDYYIAGVKALVGGESDWNTNVALDENNQIVFHDLAAGSYEFKINNGTWAWSIGGNDFLMSGECASIATTEGLGNVGFTINEVQDVTITYYPATRKICLGAVTVKAEGTVSVENMRVFVDEEGTPAITTNMADTTAADVSYTIISGGDYISISDGKIIGVAEGEAEVRINIEETAHYLAATNTFTVKVAPLAMYLVGDFNDWAIGDDICKFTVNGDFATLNYAVAEDSAVYEFKLYDKLNNNGWMGANYNFNYYWNTDVEFSKEEESNAKLYAFKAGSYTFRYKISTRELSIDFQATDPTNIEISQYEYATLFSEKGFDVPNDVEAYIITGLDGIHLNMERIYRIPAETGVLLHASEGSHPFYEADSRYMGVDVSANMLKGSLENKPVNNELVHYVLSRNSEGIFGLYWPYGTGATQGVGAFTNTGGKAYLEIPAAEQTAGIAARRGFPFRPAPEVATGIENSQEPKANSQKQIRNGQFFIIRDGRIYNAQGARVQ